MSEDIVRSFVALIKRYGFAVVPLVSSEKILELLRNRGAIHLVQVHRHSKLMVIEVNKIPCMRECDIKCRDLTSGQRLTECYNSCIDECFMSRLMLLVERLEKGSEL